MAVMVSHAMKSKAEWRIRALLAESNIAQPDEVAYGPGSVTLFWHSVKKSISVDVTERGELGESRMGPASPKWDEATPVETDRFVRIPSLREKRAAEESARKMLNNSDLRQPDKVEYGETCIRLLWNKEKLVLIVDIDDPSPSFAALQEAVGADTAGPTAA